MTGSEEPGADPVYGAKGTASPNNRPGARRRVTNWTDAFGNLWLFGGDGLAADGRGDLNDLWKYDIASNQWTWISGDSTRDSESVFGTKGVTTSSNKPGGRYASQGWKDSTGNFWLFSGDGAPDLWKYNIAGNQWTWVNGDSIFTDPIYGTQGVPYAANQPGRRSFAYTWTDATNNLWLLGGGQADDLWKYNISTYEWTWVKGDTISNAPPAYGIKGTSSITNTPGTRQAGAFWSDASGDLWLFGGSMNFGGYFNDLWRYNIASNQWTWESGDSTLDVAGDYGTKGIPSSGNKPGGKDQLSGFRDNQGNFWIFGGSGIDGNGGEGYINDLWKFTPGNILPVTLISFSGTLQNNEAHLQWIIEN